MGLIAFIKKEGSKLNITYSVKYYGVDEGQIGILSRKVPFEELILGNKSSHIKLPRIMSQPEINTFKVKKEL